VRNHEVMPEILFDALSQSMAVCSSCGGPPFFPRGRAQPKAPRPGHGATRPPRGHSAPPQNPPIQENGARLSSVKELDGASKADAERSGDVGVVAG